MSSGANASSSHIPTSEGESTARALVQLGRVISALPVAFLAVDATGKLLLLQPVVQGSAELGFSTSNVFVLGAILLASVVLYALPRTAVLGAILLTGYLGGAIATHVRIGNPLFTHTLFPVYVGVFVWCGLFLRDPRVRELLPLRRAA